VVIPTRRNRKGHASELAVREVPWVCPECGGPRGEPELKAPPFIQSIPKYMQTMRHVWLNPCGHYDPLGLFLPKASWEGVWNPSLIDQSQQ
jgi:hypothetical protein